MIVVSGAVRSIVHVWLAGVPSVLPAEIGRAHLERVAARRQARVALRARAGGEGGAVEPALEARARLVEVKLKLGAVEFVGSEGPAVIVVSGAVRSIVHVWLAGVASVLPAGSVARTSNVWLPPASPE